MDYQELYCVLNAAEGRLDILLCTEENILTSQSWYAPTRGAEILTPALDAMLKIHKLGIQNITRFACIHGPGSFTGIRLIMSTAAAIGRVTGAVSASIDYMQALAFTAQHNIQEIRPHQGHLCVITHARRNLVHGQHFTLYADSAFPKPIDDTLLYSPQTVCTQVQAHAADNTHPVYILGSGLERNKAFVEDNLSELINTKGVRLLSCEHPSPHALWQLALAATYTKQDLEPLYIRPCDAVENLDHIAAKQGMDAKLAHEKLHTLLNKPVKDIL